MKKYRTALVLGYGRSGQAAERLLLAEGTQVDVLDEQTTKKKEVVWADYEICIVSPGLSLKHPWVVAAHAAGLPLLSELELGWSRHPGRTVAVTGSNGKSTAVKWICESLQAGGKKAAIGGNYGIPACDVVMDQPSLDWLVLEVSSFQLETVQHFNPDVAVLLNLLPNHLDRHGTMEDYLEQKIRVFGNADSSGGIGMVPLDLLANIELLAGSNRSWVTFGTSVQADYSFAAGRVMHQAQPCLDLTGTLFDNPVLGGCTGAAVAAVADACGLPCSAVEAAAKSFRPLPHRLQGLGTFGGVAYVNDSKATNLAATAAALQANGHKIRLIAGGLTKESDYTFIKEILAERVRSIYLLGQASRAMYLAWNSICPCFECGTLERAVEEARRAAEPGDVVLLSPGCASFDQFRSFEERGDRFMALIQDTVQGGGMPDE